MVIGAGVAVVDRSSILTYFSTTWSQGRRSCRHVTGLTYRVLASALPDDDRLLVVLPREVGQSGDGWDLADCRVLPVVIVNVQPTWEC